MRRRRAVATAQGRECLICRRLSRLRCGQLRVASPGLVSNLTHAISMSIEYSKGSVDSDFWKDLSPGVSDSAADAILTERPEEPNYRQKACVLTIGCMKYRMLHCSGLSENVRTDIC